METTNIKLPNNFQIVEGKLPLINIEKISNDEDKELILFELPKNVFIIFKIESMTKKIY